MVADETGRRAESLFAEATRHLGEGGGAFASVAHGLRGRRSSFGSDRDRLTAAFAHGMAAARDASWQGLDAPARRELKRVVREGIVEVKEDLGHRGRVRSGSAAWLHGRESSIPVLALALMERPYFGRPRYAFAQRLLDALERPGAFPPEPPPDDALLDAWMLSFHLGVAAGLYDLVAAPEWSEAAP